MNIRQLEVTAFSIPFARPLAIGGTSVEARTGVLVRLHGDDGRVGLGEAAPHPLAGEAVLRDMMQSIAAAREVLHLAGPTELDAVLDRLEAVRSPEARAGLEMACWDLAAQAADVRLAEMLGSDRSSRVPLLTKEGSGEVLQRRVSNLPLAPSLARRGFSGPTQRRRVPVNALVDRLDPAEAASAARELVSQGFCCLKLKVGGDVRQDIARVAAVRAAVGPQVRLRIDANGVWSLDEALRFLPQLAAYDLDYVEQPVPDAAVLAQVRRAVDVPIAADECVTDAAAVQRLAALRAADVIVVKPALLGLRAAVAVVRTAQACGMKVVVTSVLDTSIGIAAALHLAATLPDPVLPCGLATASLLAGDLAREPLVPRGGWLEVPPGPGLGVQLDTELLGRWGISLPPSLRDCRFSRKTPLDTPPKDGGYSG
jgi:L-alanine-DL-glutamate epimerase-like enolase superfamily enzyme